MSLPLNQYNDPVFDHGRRVIRYFTVFNCAVLCLVLIVVNKFGRDWKFFWYEYQQLKFLFLMTAINYVFAFSVAIYLSFFGKKLTLPSFYKKRIADLKSGTVDANLWDAAGTFMGYNYIRNYALGSIIFLLTPLIFGLLFIFPGLVGTLAVLIIVGAAQWFLIPAVLILWIFIFGDKK